MSDGEMSVPITADALIELRLHSPLATQLALPGSHDALFHTAQGRELARMALSVDPVYEQYNLARYRWFCDRIDEAAATLPQLVILGAGFDTRAMTLPSVRRHAPRVFEVDLPATVAQKRAVLAAAGLGLPDHLRMIPATIGVDDVAGLLAASGYDCAQPAAVLIEGLHFFLPAPAARLVLDPAFLPLAPGSRIFADLWTAARQASLNAVLLGRIGRALFGVNPFGDTTAAIAGACRALGHRTVSATPLSATVAGFGIDPIADPLGESWLLLQAET